MHLTTNQNALLLTAWEKAQAGSPMRVQLTATNADASDFRDLVSLGFLTAFDMGDGWSTLRPVG